jgi:acetoin utilization deacetylase AcuC-like enzyme
MTGKVRNAFCAFRPPGHHAEKATAMGFRFFDTASIAARHAQSRRHGRSASPSSTGTCTTATARRMWSWN